MRRLASWREEASGATRTFADILPRVCAGGTALKRGGEGKGLSSIMRAPPDTKVEAATASTALGAVPLPRVAGEDRRRKPVPSLIRFLILAGGLAAAIYGAMYALVATVQVQPREMTQIIEIPKAPK